jgi:hypothetical protein
LPQELLHDFVVGFSALALIEHGPIVLQSKTSKTVQNMPGTSRHFARRINIFNPDQPSTLPMLGLQKAGDGGYQ